MSKIISPKISSVAKPKKGTFIIFNGANVRPSDKVLKIANEDFVNQLIKVHGFKGEVSTAVESIQNNEQGYDRLILIGAGEVDKYNFDDWMKLGGSTAAQFGGSQNITVALSFADITPSKRDIADFISGIMLRLYDFDKYKTKAKKDNKAPVKLTIQADDEKLLSAAFEKSQQMVEAIILARDLINEPANILGPVEFAEEIQKLEKLGLKIEILGEKELRKLGANAILGVARGSARPPRLAIMRWNGSASKDNPIAFVGKGVVFDTGGISLKGGAGMEDMKGDMGGAAAVVGAMRLLAARKAKVNAVGVVGLVENMPDGDAQRPGDIVTSMSGQTIEIINTDAEGRLVLADALWYTKEKFKPKLMIDLATLTGAIMVALGHEHAGLFANDDALADHLLDAGRLTGEKLWRMPLGKEYDKIVDSKFADMRNSTGRLAGSVTAAQFLKRFVGDTPWAHLDIAGAAIDSIKNEYNQSWASGFGVRLLDRFVAEYYED